MPSQEKRILAIDPGTRFMGVAVLEGDTLVYYGVRVLWMKRPLRMLLGATRTAVRRLIADYRPSSLAYEKTFYVQSRASALLRAHEAEIRRIGEEAGLRVVGLTPASVRTRLCGNGYATKQRVAGILAHRFPELAAYVPKRAPPLQERYWLHMFDALAVAVVSQNERARQHGQAA